MLTVLISIVKRELGRREWHELDFVQKNKFLLEVFYLFFFKVLGSIV